MGCRPRLHAVAAFAVGDTVTEHNRARLGRSRGGDQEAAGEGEPAECSRAQGVARRRRPHAGPRAAEALTLEHELSDLVNAAYGLTPAEIELMWDTAPPRMPIGRPTLRQ